MKYHIGIQNLLIFFNLEKVKKEEKKIDKTQAKQRENDKEKRGQEQKKDSFRKNEQQ